MKSYIAYKRYYVTGLEDEDIVLQLQKLQFINRDADIHEFMLGFSNRASVLGEIISSKNACEFVRDLLYYGYLEEVKVN